MSNDFDRAAAFDKWLSQAPDVWLECKVGGHYFVNASVQLEGGAYVEWVECARGCGVQRTRQFSARTGLPVGVPHYRYPPGYVAIGAGSRDAATRGAMRLNCFANRVPRAGGARAIEGD